jgi:RHS repeat-associated protein
MYDRDGRVASKTWRDAVGYSSIDFAYGFGWNQSSMDAVFKSLFAFGVPYSYYYDAFGRRRLKRYPAGVGDEFFYDTVNRLLVDKGNRFTSGGSANDFPFDDYVWLDGRPVVLVRGKFSNTWVRQSDTSADCRRNGEIAGCGLFFPITDHIGKPVLMLDSARRITGTGEYEPFGRMNRVVMHAASSPIPYTPNMNQLIATISHGSHANVTTQLRARFPYVNAEWDFCLEQPRDFVRLANSSNIELERISNVNSNVVSAWHALSDGILKVSLVTDADNVYRQNVCVSGGCTCEVRPGTFLGASMDSYEYRRYQTGASWFFTPIRFPGQYHDAETDLYENWNRYYDPAIGRYLQPDPLAATDPMSGAEQAYAYARTNPLQYTDPKGLYTKPADCTAWASALAKARQVAGCSRTRDTDKSCECQKKLNACAPPCDVCKFLSDEFLVPVLSVKDLLCDGKRSDGCTTSTKKQDGRFLPRQVEVDSQLCEPKNTDRLAQTLIHESSHVCSMVTGKQVTDDVRDECSACAIASACFGRPLGGCQ